MFLTLLMCYNAQSMIFGKKTQINITNTKKDKRYFNNKSENYLQPGSLFNNYKVTKNNPKIL